MKEKGKREEVTVWLFGWVNNWKEKYNNILIQKNDLFNYMNNSPQT